MNGNSHRILAHQWHWGKVRTEGTQLFLFSSLWQLKNAKFDKCSKRRAPRWRPLVLEVFEHMIASFWPFLFRVQRFGDCGAFDILNVRNLYGSLRIFKNTILKIQKKKKENHFTKSFYRFIYSISYIGFVKRAWYEHRPLASVPSAHPILPSSTWLMST